MAARRPRKTTGKAAPRRGATAVKDRPAPEPEVTEAEVVEDHTGTVPVDDEGQPLISKEIVLRGRTGGILTLSPFQERLNDEQRAALVAIGIDTNKDPGITPHVRPFIHLCQTRGLDPWLREAYLIGRGDGDWRRYTMQTGIDGYLKIAKATGRFRRIAAVLWTGTDDDPSSWRETTDEFGNLVMKRVWFDQWPEAKGHPGSAKVIIEHYDELGKLTHTDGQADWAMYAPYTPKYEGKRPNRRKVTDEHGKVVMELGEFWTKGGAHMLAKCATALAIRKAFPGATAGMLTTEEMHQADAVEMQRMDAARLAAITERAAERRAEGADRPASAEPPSDEEAALLGDTAAAEPLIPPMVEPSGPEEITPTEPPRRQVFDEEQVREWLLDELDQMAEITGTSVAALTRRWAVGAKKNVGDPDVPVVKIQQLVAGLRPMVIEVLRGTQPEQAEAYAQIPPEESGPPQWLIGLAPRVSSDEDVVDGEIVPDTADEDDEEAQPE